MADAKVKDVVSVRGPAGSDEDSSGGTKGKLAPDAAPVGFLELFRYTTGYERFIMFFGVLGGIGNGGAMPMFSILLGGLFNDFNSPNPDDVLAAGNKYAGLFGIVAASVAALSFLQVACFTFVAERTTLRLRKLYLDAILRQEIAFFDQGSGELTARVAESTVIIREALSEKLGMLCQFGAMFVAGFAVGFYVQWQLTLVVLAVTPLLAAGGYSMMKLMSAATSGALDAYSKAGGVAEEAFGMMTTVMAFGLEGRTARRYEARLGAAERFGIKKSRDQGLGMAMTMATFFLTYALALYVACCFVSCAFTVGIV
jgi:ATP-binding cassette subfamily B (MDR/TAP) protein 1